MADEEKTPVDDVTEPLEPIEPTEPAEETEPTEPTKTVETQEPTEAGEPKWKTRHRSPEEVFAENSRLQSELDRTRRQLESQGVQIPKPTKTSEELLREFAVDPLGFVQKAIAPEVAPVRGRQYLNDFLSEGDNAKRFGPYRNELSNRLNGDFSSVANPMLMKAAFLLIEDEVKSAKLDVAANTMREHKETVAGVKQKQAFVEGSSAGAPKTVAAEIKPGMSQKEMDKNLDALGVPTVER